MAYAMPLKAKPNGSNQLAAQELSPQYARELLQRIGAAADALRQVAEAATATPEQVVSALAQWRAAQPELRRVEHHLAGVAVLGGASVTGTAGKLRIKPADLSKRLSGTPAMHRGANMIRSTDGAWSAIE